MFENSYIPIKRLSTRLGLSARYLKKLADDGLIPSLEINGRLRFNPSQAQDALDQLAEKRCSQTQEAQSG